MFNVSDPFFFLNDQVHQGGALTYVGKFKVRRKSVMRIFLAGVMAFSNFIP